MIKKIELKIYNLTQKYGAKFGIDLAYFVKNGFWLLLSHFISIAKGLIIILLFTNFLGAEKFGQYSFILSVIGIIGIFGLPGAGIAIIQSVSRGYEGTYKYLLKKLLRISLIGSFVLIGFGLYLKYFQNYEYYLIFIIIALFYPLYNISGFYSYFLTGTKRFDLRTKFEFIANIIITITSIILIYITKNIIYIIPILLFSQTIINLYFEKYLIKNANKEIDFESFPYSIKLSLLAFFQVIKVNIDKIIVTYYGGFIQTGIYSLSLSINDQIYSLGKIIGNLFMPKTANLKKEELNKHIKKITIILFVIFGFLSIILILLYPFIIPFVFGKDFSDAIFYSQILTGFVAIKSTFAVLQLIDNSQKELKSTIFSSTISPIIEIFLMIILGYFFNILGIIIAKIIGDSINLGYFLYFNRKNNSF